MIKILVCGTVSIYLFILQHPLSSIMCSCAVSARIKERLQEIKSAIVRLDKSVSKEDVRLKDV